MALGCLGENSSAAAAWGPGRAQGPGWWGLGSKDLRSITCGSGDGSAQAGCGSTGGSRTWGSPCWGRGHRALSGVPSPTAWGRGCPSLALTMLPKVQEHLATTG